MYAINLPHGVYLMHHGVKGMKWGVRKADYKSSGLKSNNIYDRLDDLAAQESRAHSENRSGYRNAKRTLKSEAKSRVKEAKAANKQARKEYNKSFNKAWGFSQRHAVTTMLKKHKNYQKNQDNWEDAINKAEAYKNTRKNLKETKASAKESVKTGKAAAREIYRKNSDKIVSDFDKAHYKTIGQSYIKEARKINAGIEIATLVVDKAIGIDHDSSSYQTNKAKLDNAEERRKKYADSKSK